MARRTAFSFSVFSSFSLLVAAGATTTGVASAGVATAPAATDAPLSQAQVAERLAGAAVHFEPNVGQFPTAPDGQPVLYGARVSGYRMQLTPGSIHFFLERSGGSAHLVQRHIGASAAPELVGEGALPGKVHRLLGSRDQHKKSIPTFANVRYRELYPGIDLLCYGNQRRLESDYVVAPGADPKQIQISFEGAEEVFVNADGDLVVRTAAGELEKHAPFAYQMRGAEQVEIPSRYRIEAGVVHFELGDYDTSRELVIDPVLVYSSYFGGSSLERNKEIARDSSGNIYILGVTSSTDLPTTSPAQASSGGSDDAFVMKLSPDGETVLFATYLGGNQNEEPAAIQVHSDGSVYIAGHTSSADFPTSRCNTGGFTNCSRACDPGETAAFQNFCGNASEIPANYCMDVTGCFTPDAFLTRLNAAGDTILYSTFIGGSDNETVRDLYVDSAGLAYIVGSTSSSSTEPPNDTAGNNEAFPVSANALDKLVNDDDLATNLLDTDAFLAVIDPTQDYALGRIYLSYLGGSDQDDAWRVVLDANGHIYITGKTESDDFPALNGWSTTRLGTGSDLDAFLIKLDRNQAGANQNLYGTYFGGDNREDPYGLLVPAPDEVYLSGATPGNSSFPRTSGALQETWPGGFSDAGFLSRFDTSVGGTASLMWSTYLGSGAGDAITDIGLGPSGDIFFIGNSNNASQLPLVRDFVPGEASANSFFGSLSTDGTTLGFLGSYRMSAPVPKFTIDPTTGVTTVLGESETNILDSAAKDTASGGDVAIAQLLPTDTDIVLSVSGSPNPIVTGNEVTYTVTATNAGPSRVAQFDLRGFLDDGGAGITTGTETATVTQGNGTCDTAQFGRTCVVYDLDVGQSFVYELAVTPTGAEGTLGYNVELGGFLSPGGVFHTDTDDTNDTAVGDVSVVFTLPAGADLTVSQTDSPDPVQLGSNVTYTVTATNQGPDAATGVMVTDTLPSGASFVSATPSQGSCSGTGPVTCDLGALAASANATIDVVVTPSSSGSITNSVTISGNETDAVASNDSSDETTTVTDPPAGTPQMSAGPCATPISGQTVAPGSTDVPVLQFELGGDSDQDVSVTSLGLSASGSGDESMDVTGFSVYRDLNGDGVVDAADELLASGTFSGDDAVENVSFSQTATVAQNDSACILVAYDFSASAGGVVSPPSSPDRFPWLPFGLSLLVLGTGFVTLRKQKRRQLVPVLAAASLFVGAACGSDDKDKGASAAGSAGTTGSQGGSSGEGGTGAVSGNAGQAGSSGSAGMAGSSGAAGTGGTMGTDATFSLQLTSVGADGETSGTAAIVSGLPFDGVTITVQ